ncbi:MAG TPA: hypothetical protein ENN34_03855 [Deltaproteobacteria bacterium]|nr:hypothetical protein [Deltaproteobacteria bacterium]
MQEAVELACSRTRGCTNYCRTLIETVGFGGGFILSSGCSIPANAKQETIRALSEAIMEWGFY